MVAARSIRMPKHYGNMWTDIRGGGDMPELNRTHLVTLYRGKFDPDAWMRSIAWVIERHPILSACIVPNAEGPQLMLQPAAATPLLRIDLGNPDDEDVQARLQHTVHALIWQPFDQHMGLCRAFMVAVSDSEYVLGVVVHHLIADGWSMGIIGREILLGYAAALAGRRPSRPDPLVQFTDYLEWFSDWLEGEQAQSQKSYWSRQMLGASPVTLPVARELDPEAQIEVATEPVELESALLRTLAVRARELMTTPFILLLTAKFAALSLVTGSQDIVIGVVSDAREEFRLRNTIGHFAHYLPIRVRVDEGQSVTQLLAVVQQTYRDAWENRQYPFLASDTLRGGFPLFRYRRVAARDPVPEHRNAGGFQSFELPPAPLTRIKAKLFPVHFLEIEQTGDEACGTMRYLSEAHERQAVADFTRVFCELVKAIAHGGEMPLRSLR